MLRICISQSPNSCSKQQLNTQYQHGYTVPGSYQVPYGCVNLVVAAPWILVHEKSRMESVPHDVRMPPRRRKQLFTPEGDHYTELIRLLRTGTQVKQRDCTLPVILMSVTGLIPQDF